MKIPRYLTLKEIGVLVLFAHVPVFFYNLPLMVNVYQRGVSWAACLVSYLGTLLMFTWKINVGEQGYILLFGHDTKLRTGPGLFLAPSLLPFLRGWGIIFGVSVESDSPQHHGNTVNVHHFQDQRVPAVRVNVESGHLSALIGLAASNLTIWFFNVFDPNGKLKFGKIGGYLYFGSWIYVLMAR